MTVEELLCNVSQVNKLVGIIMYRIFTLEGKAANPEDPLEMGMHAQYIHHTQAKPASIRCFVWLARSLQTRLWCRDTCKHLLNERYKHIDPLATRLAPRSTEQSAAN